MELNGDQDHGVSRRAEAHPSVMSVHSKRAPHAEGPFSLFCWPAADRPLLKGRRDADDSWDGDARCPDSPGTEPKKPACPVRDSEDDDPVPTVTEEL